MSGVDVLTHSVPIVDKVGNPTKEFMIKWRQLADTLGTIPALSTAAQVSAVLDKIALTAGMMLVRGASQWSGLALGASGDVLTAGASLPAWSTLSALLDSIFGSAQGSILYRDSGVWKALGPGTSGQVLTTQGASANPKWAAGGGGGGGVIIGAGAPTSLQAAGTVYSRSDQPELYSSTPVVSSGAAVRQFTGNIAGNSTPGSFTLGLAPTPGNLIVAFIHWDNNGVALPTINTAAWTQFLTVAGSSQFSGFAVYRYAQVGDTAALPAICTAGSQYWGGTVYEISGVSGTFASDVTAMGGTYATTTSSNSSSLACSSGNLAIFSAGAYNGGSNPSLSALSGGTLTTDQSSNNNFNFGAIASGHFSSTSSGNVQISVSGAPGGSSLTTMGIVVAGSGSSSPGWTEITPAKIPLAGAVTPFWGSAFGSLVTQGIVVDTITPTDGMVLRFDFSAKWNTAYNDLGIGIAIVDTATKNTGYGWFSQHNGDQAAWAVIGGGSPTLVSNVGTTFTRGNGPLAQSCEICFSNGGANEIRWIGAPIHAVQDSSINLCGASATIIAACHQLSDVGSFWQQQLN